MNPLFKKPKDVRYVDMAIWIDENIYSENCDMDKAFTYMYLLAYMLASKAKYFKNLNDYDGFAYSLAFSTYSRYMDPNKKKIKSVLNYMKSIMYFRKLTYDRETFCEVINPEYNVTWDDNKYKLNKVVTLESQNRSNFIQLNLDGIFAELPALIQKNIPGVYTKDKSMRNCLYKSVLLSLISSYTLPQINQEKLEEKIDKLTSFNETNFYRRYLTQDIILWHLPQGMESVVKLIINKVNKELIEIIRSLSNDIKVTDYDLELMFKSAYENWNEEGY